MERNAQKQTASTRTHAALRLGVLALLLFSFATAHAVTFTVSNTSDAGPGSFRQAVIDANASPGEDAIDFDPSVFSAPQTITLASRITIDSPDNAKLQINGPGKTLLTVSGNNAVGLLTIAAGETVGFANLHFSQGSGANLAGAISNNGTLTVSNCVFSSNTGNQGGAIANLGTLTVGGCTFTGNQATSGSATGLGGGAIYSFGVSASIIASDFSGNMEVGGSGGGGAVRNRQGTMTMSSCVFTDNTAVDGGGAVQNSDIMSMTSCTITGNSTAGSGSSNGGGVSNTSAGQLTIITSLIAGNSAANNGGGIYYQPNATTGPFMQMTGTTVANNTANMDGVTPGDGGGIFVTGSGSVAIERSTISGNMALGSATSAGNGGGIDIEGIVTLTNSTISGNSAGRDGGGLRASGTSTRVVTIDSSTIAHNAAANSGGGIVRVSSGNPLNIRNTLVANNTANAGVASDLSGTVTSQGYNLVETSSAFVGGDQTGNIYGVDPNIGPLEDNGGLTFTHALLSGSPAIDKGNSGGVTTDQRGFARPFDFASVPNAADGADIGAYEVDATPPIVEFADSLLAHGDAGVFGVPLLGDSLGIESRRGTGSGDVRNYTIRLRFNRPITGGTASMTGTGSVGTVSITGREMTVSLTGVADAQIVTLTVSNVTTQDGGNLASTSIQIGFLIGDVNGNGSVNVGDALLAKNRSGQSTDPGNFRTDVNPDGIINAGDALIVRGRSGNFLP